MFITKKFLKQSLGALEANLSSKFSTKEYLKQSLGTLEASLSQKIDEKVDEGIHSLKVLIEAVRFDLNLLVEGRQSDLAKSDACDHQLKNHETRITTLEDYTYTKDRLK